MAEYINRFALIDCLCNELETISCEIADSVCDFAEGFGEAINVVELFERDAKDEVAPIRHGKWEGYTRSQFIGTDEMGEPKYRNGRIYYCSRCGYRSIIQYNYCPQCGAKLSKGEDNDSR